MVNIFFLFGDDSYRLQKRLREIQNNIKTGDFGVSQIDASEKWDINRFENELTAIGFFGGERLVIVKNLLASKEVDVEKVTGLLSKAIKSQSSRANARDLDEISPPRLTLVEAGRDYTRNDKKDEIPASAGMTSGGDGVSIVIIENGVPDKRTKLYKWLQKNGRSEQFIKLVGADWNRFASDIIVSRQIKLAPSARSLLITETEGDSWQLINVLDQLGLWANNINRQLEVEDVTLFVKRRLRGNSFQLLDALARGNINIALRHLEDLWAQGEAPLRVLGAVVYQYRQLIFIKAATDEGIDSYELVRELKIPPFVVQKIMPMAKNMSWDKLKKIFCFIAKIDEALKSGKIEPVAGIEILVYNLIGLHKNQEDLIIIK